MKFAQRVFAIAGCYGLLTLIPMLFLEKTIARVQPPAITHPEYFYGFLSVAIACQVMFLIIARDPKRFRPIMVVAILEKFGWVLAASGLMVQQRIPWIVFTGAVIDLLLGFLFIAAYAKTDAALTSAES